MADYSWPELNESVGSSVADGTLNIVNGARDFACTLYQNSPGAAVGFADPTGIGAFNKGLWDRMCKPIDKVPALPPSSPFTGGQCPILYNVTASVTSTINGAPGATDTRTFTGLQGPIKGFRQVADENPTPPVEYTVYLDYAGGSESFGVQGIGSPAITSIDSIVPTGGGPDSCGNPPIEYPNTDAPPIEFKTNINVDVGGINVTIPVEFKPTVWVVPVILAPQINVNAGPLTISFGPDGANVTINPDVDINFTLPNKNDPSGQLPPAKPPVTTADDCCDAIFDRFDDVDTQLDKIEQCACGPETEVLTLTFGAANSRTVTIPSGRFIAARLVADAIGARVRGQYGGGGAPDVEFLGWCSFGKGGNFGERIPVSYAGNYFIAPDAVSQFSYTLQDDSTATLLVEYEAEVNP